jgi:hypothetical protein
MSPAELNQLEAFNLSKAGYSYKQIAEHQGTSNATAGYRVKRGRRVSQRFNTENTKFIHKVEAIIAAREEAESTTAEPKHE